MLIFDVAIVTVISIVELYHSSCRYREKRKAKKVKTITEEIEAKDFSDLRGSYTYYLCILGFDLLANMFQVVIWFD